MLRPVSAITLLLGLIYTLKVFDIVWIMTRGGPADSSSTLATLSYRLGFGNMLPAFSPGAAVGNLLIVIALLFGLIYIRVQRSQDTP
jgi:multiple sugar transport system permease protein